MVTNKRQKRSMERAILSMLLFYYRKFRELSYNRKYFTENCFAIFASEQQAWHEN